MTHVSYTDLRKNLAHYLDEAANSRAPIVVTRTSAHQNVVILSEEEFSGLQETVHLLNSPKNTQRLLKGIEQASQGKLEEHTLITPDDTASNS
ncbi:type II toxin-antitoxin system Phd/YefM family antitoxin [Entomobacter blattae]|uniref:Antitoxin n=1 Tax=Entomobacter blattae TaxID=2762277 RepID=A0A7H1NUG1_9PROT|nr:type II toxin-antitoxin system prevent-host-death family antitoxin [Entomobacter blattae]QNT79421.1 Antitoxin YefM [Entomobacter blattae]